MISLIGNDSPIEFMNFPDGESFVKFDYNNKPINILWRYENDAEFMTIFQMFDVMARIAARADEKFDYAQLHQSYISAQEDHGPRLPSKSALCSQSALRFGRYLAHNREEGDA